MTLGHWPNIEPTMAECSIFAGYCDAILAGFAVFDNEI